MPTYRVMGEAEAYIEADSPDDAERKAECLDPSEWDFFLFSSSEEQEEW
jgi:hypothetical protein